MSGTVTSRKSPRCVGVGALIEGVNPGHIAECPTCRRPVRLQRPALIDGVAGALVPSHGTIETRNTRAADDRMRYLMSHQR